MTDLEKIEFIESAIFELFGRNITVEPDDNLLELSLDSLDIVELQMYYEDAAKIEIPHDATCTTVKELMDLMA